MAITVDTIVVVLAAWFVLRGFQKGLVRQILQLVAVIAAAVIVYLFVTGAAALLVHVGFDKTLAIPLAGVTLFLGSWVLLGLVVSRVVKRIRKSSLSILDRGTGAALAFVKLSLGLSFALEFLAAFPLVGDVMDESLTVPWVRVCGAGARLLIPSSVLTQTQMPSQDELFRDWVAAVELLDRLPSAETGRGVSKPASTPESRRRCAITIGTRVTLDGPSERYVCFRMDRETGTNVLPVLREAYNARDQWSAREFATPSDTIFSAERNGVQPRRITSAARAGELRVVPHLLTVEHFWTESIEPTTLLGGQTEVGEREQNRRSETSGMTGVVGRAISATGNRELTLPDKVDIEYRVELPGPVVDAAGAERAGTAATFIRSTRVGVPVTFEARSQLPRRVPQTILTLLSAAVASLIGLKTLQFVSARRKALADRRREARRHLFD